MNIKKELYEVLTVKNLIKYGYYQIPKNKPKTEWYGSIDAVNTNLFNLDDFYRWVEDNNIKNKYKIDLKRFTEPIEFTIQKSGLTRRLYKYPNLYSYFIISSYIEEKKDFLTDILANNKHSTSKFFNIGYNFKNTKNIERNNLHVGNNILCLDLSSFYHTLYTHSIEWMIHGKDLSKTKRNSQLNEKDYSNDEHVGKALDTLIQKCQFNETHGIPTGNMVSQIVAEIYMCKFDEKLSNRGFTHFSRYVDDIKYSYANDEDKNSFLMDFHDICIEHGLTVNGEKTKETSFSKLRLDDKSYLTSLINQIRPKQKNIDKITQINLIIDYAVFQQGEGNKGELKFLFSCLKSLIKKVGIKNTEDVFLFRNKRNPESIFTRLLDLTLKYPDLTNRFLYFVEKLVKRGCSKKRINNSARKYFKANKKEIINLLIHYINNNYNQELLGILTMFVVFDIRFPFKKLKPKYVFSSQIDDFNLIVFSSLYRNHDAFDSIKFIKYVSNIFDKVDSDQTPDNIVYMQRKHWMFRYYFFYLSYFELIDSQDIQNYVLYTNKKNKSGILRQNTNDGSVVYKTGIDYKWVLERNNKDHPINKFYKEMLEDGIKLFDDSLLFIKNK